MSQMPLSEVKAHLSTVVDDVEGTAERVTITRHGKPAAVIVSIDDLTSLEETVWWASRPGISTDVEDAATGRGYERMTADELRASLRAERHAG